MTTVVTRPGVIGRIPGLRWRLPRELRIVRAFSRVSGGVWFKAAFAEGAWCYQVTAEDRPLLDFLKRVADLQDTDQPRATNAVDPSATGPGKPSTRA